MSEILGFKSVLVLYTNKASQSYSETGELSTDDEIMVCEAENFAKYRDELAEKIIRERKADFVAIGRSLLADPEWPLKVQEGRLEDIRPCIGCQDGCLARVATGAYISYAVNPATGNEKEFTITRAEKSCQWLPEG